MSGWARKPFWTKVAVVPEDGDYAIQLDGRPVRTPGKSPLRVPTRALGEHIASEWRAQTESIRPETMPATRMANSAIEKVRPQMQAVADHLLAYGETDLLCYRAEGPEALTARQSAVWDPWIEWAKAELGADLQVTAGIVPVSQELRAITCFRAEVEKLDHFGLAAFHDLVTLPGSLVLGLAAARGAAPAATIWEAARIDEIWQAEQWGQDDEAESANLRKARAFEEALRFLELARNDD